MAGEHVQRGDFVEIDYTGKVKNSGEVFDTTSEQVARAAGILREGAAYGPVIICVGKGHVLKGLDERLIGTEPGQHYVLFLKPDQGFGNRDPKLLQLVSTSKFVKQDIFPFPGLQVSFEGLVGMVKTVSGGRTVVDFNHPLAGKELEYEVTVRRAVTAPVEKAQALLRLRGLRATAKEGEGGIVIEPEENIPETVKEQIQKEMEETAEIHGATFSEASPGLPASPGPRDEATF